MMTQLSSCHTATEYHNASMEKRAIAIVMKPLFDE